MDHRIWPLTRIEGSIHRSILVEADQAVPHDPIDAVECAGNDYAPIGLQRDIPPFGAPDPMILWRCDAAAGIEREIKRTIRIQAGNAAVEPTPEPTRDHDLAVGLQRGDWV